MRVLRCDFCDSIINNTYYMMALKKDSIANTKKTEQIQNPYATAKDIASYVNKVYSSVEGYDICPECMKVIKKLFKTRKKHLKEMKKEIERSYKKSNTPIDINHNKKTTINEFLKQKGEEDDKKEK